MTTTCCICGRELNPEERAYQTENTKDDVCMHDASGEPSDKCIKAHMLQNITASEIDECFSGHDFTEERERFRQGGLEALNDLDMEILLEWYIDNFTWTFETDADYDDDRGFGNLSDLAHELRLEERLQRTAKELLHRVR